MESIIANPADGARTGLVRRNAERLEDQDVLKRIRKVVLPADDVADPEVRVIRAGA